MTSTEYKKCEDRAFYLLLGCIALGVFAFITEMVFIPDEVEDGDYLLNLQIAPFFADTSPSRPILYKINDIQKK